MKPREQRGERDPRGPHDARDERDVRGASDDRDPRDPRELHEPTSNRMLLWGFIMLGFAILAVIGLGTAMFIQLQSQAATQTQLEHTILQACDRENVLRREDNNAHFGDYVVFSFVTKRFTKPTKTETAAQKKITDQFAGALSAAVKDSSWTPVTDCTRAVSTEGVNYESPVPVAFTTRLPPPSALPTR